MSRVWQKICAYAGGVISDRDSGLSHAQHAENRRVKKVRKEIHRLIENQLIAQNNHADRQMSTLSELPQSRSANWWRNRSVDSRVRKLLAQKFEHGEGTKTDYYPTSLRTVRAAKSTNANDTNRLYELTVMPPLPGATSQVLNRTRAEIELHVLCESGFRLAAGTLQHDDGNEGLTLTELMPPRRSSEAQIAAALPKWTSAPSLPVIRKARPRMDLSAWRFNAPRPSLTARSRRSTTASKSGFERTATRTAVMDRSIPSWATTSAKPQSAPQLATAEKSAEKSTEAPSHAIYGSPLDSVETSLSVRNPTTYCASALDTDIKKVIQQAARSRTRTHISSTEFNCAWRCAWAMILTQQDPHAIEQKIIDLLGENFRVEAEALKRICGAVHQRGLDAILSNDRDSGRMVYRDNGPELENLLNRLAGEVLQKCGVAQSTVTHYFAPATMVSAEEIMPLVNAMGASCVVLQGRSDIPSDTDTISFQPKNNRKIASLEITEKGWISPQIYVDALEGLPIAVITDNHFDLLLPAALLRKNRNA